MSKILGSVLAGLLVIQGGMFTIPMPEEVRAGVVLGVSALIAGLTFWLKE